MFFILLPLLLWPSGSGTQADKERQDQQWYCFSVVLLIKYYICTVQPRLSGPRLSGTSIIRTSHRPLPHMRRRRDRWSFVGVVIDWVMSYRLALAKIDWPKYFSEHCWPWLYCIGIVYRLGIINQCRHFSYPDISLIRYGSDRPVDKGGRLIEVALYNYDLNLLDTV